VKRGEERCDAISPGEAALTALDRYPHLIAQITGDPHPHPRSFV
jgi:hypothetical protein